MNDRRGVLAEATLPDGTRARLVTGDAITADELAQLARLLRAAFADGWPAFPTAGTLEDHLAWKLRGPSRARPSLVTLIERDERIASMAIALRESVLVNGQEQVFEGGADACTDPAYQGQGLFTQRREFEAGNLERWLDGEISHSLNPIVLDRRVRHGDAAPRDLEPRVYVRVISPRLLAREVLDRPRLARPFLALALSAYQRFRSARWPIRAGVVTQPPVPVTTFDHRFDGLFEDAASEFDLIKVRSAEYLNWRYADPGGARYHPFAIEDGGSVLGYIVLRLDAGRGYIMDLLARPARSDVVAALLAHGEHWFRQHAVSAIICWMRRSDPYRPQLERRGFFDAHRRTGVVVRSYAGGETGPHAVAADPRRAVRLMLGDSDRA